VTGAGRSAGPGCPNATPRARCVSACGGEQSTLAQTACRVQVRSVSFLPGGAPPSPAPRDGSADVARPDSPLRSCRP
jgi:hypothetical protein